MVCIRHDITSSVAETHQLAGFRRWLVSSEKATTRTAKAYVSDVKAFLATTSGEVLDRQLLEAALDRFFAVENLSASTLRRMRAALRHYFSYPGVDEGVRRVGLAWLDTLIDVKSRDRRFIEVSHIERLLEAVAESSKDIHKVRNISLIAFMYATGFTLKKAVSLTWVFIVDYDGNAEQSFEEIYVGPSDTIPLHQDAQRALSHWLREQQRLPGLAKRSELENVWCNVSLNPSSDFNGSSMSEITITKLLVSLSKAIGLATPVSAADIRDLTLRQLGPGLETYALVNQDVQRDAVGTPDFYRAMETRLERIQPLQNLERLLSDSHYQASLRPPVFTLDHAKLLVKGALRERGTVEAARAVSLVGFLIGTGLSLEKALAVRRSQVQGSGDFGPHLLLYDYRHILLSALAQAALSLWFQWAGDGPYQGESLIKGEVPIWWFKSSSNSNVVAAWHVLDHASSLGGLGFTATAPDLKQLFQSMLGSSEAQATWQEPPLEADYDDSNRPQSSSNLRQESSQQLLELSVALRKSAALNTFTAWYKNKVEEKFGQLRPFDSIVQSW